MCRPQPSTAASMAGPGWRFLLLVHPNKLILMLRGRTKFTFSVAFVRLTWICSIDALCLGKAPLGCKSSSCPSKASSEPVKLFHSISAETNERGDYLCSAFWNRCEILRCSLQIQNGWKIIVKLVGKKINCMQVGRWVYLYRDVAIMVLLALQYRILLSDKLSSASRLLQFLHPGVSNPLVSVVSVLPYGWSWLEGFLSKSKFPAGRSTRTNCCNEQVRADHTGI